MARSRDIRRSNARPAGCGFLVHRAPKALALGETGRYGPSLLWLSAPEPSRAAGNLIGAPNATSSEKVRALVVSPGLVKPGCWSGSKRLQALCRGLCFLALRSGHFRSSVQSCQRQERGSQVPELRVAYHRLAVVPARPVEGCVPPPVVVEDENEITVGYALPTTPLARGQRGGSGRRVVGFFCYL